MSAQAGVAWQPPRAAQHTAAHRCHPSRSAPVAAGSARANVVFLSLSLSLSLCHSLAQRALVASRTPSWLLDHRQHRHYPPLLLIHRHRHHHHHHHHHHQRSLTFRAAARRRSRWAACSSTCELRSIRNPQNEDKPSDQAARAVPSFTPFLPLSSFFLSFFLSFSYFSLSLSFCRCCSP